MAITKDSGVRSNAAVGLADLDAADRNLIDRRQTAFGDIPGTEDMDVPVNAPPHTGPHVAPLWLMYGVFAALLVLTGATVAARTWMNLGPTLNIVVALGLAVAKAILVALFFMHLWWDSKLNQIVFVISLLLLTLFIGITILDSHQYQPILDPPQAYSASPEVVAQ